MDDRAKFWARYLPIKEKIIENIHHVEVENAFNNLFNRVFTNKHKITELPTRMKFEILDMLRYYQDYNSFLKDFYLTYKKKLNEHQEIMGRKQFESFYDFEIQTGGSRFDYFFGLENLFLELEKTLVNK